MWFSSPKMKQSCWNSSSQKVEIVSARECLCISTHLSFSLHWYQNSPQSICADKHIFIKKNPNKQDQAEPSYTTNKQNQAWREAASLNNGTILHCLRSMSQTWRWQRKDFREQEHLDEFTYGTDRLLWNTCIVLFGWQDNGWLLHYNWTSTEL